MTVVLGANQYGKAENRVVRIYRDTADKFDPFNLFELSSRNVDDD